MRKLSAAVGIILVGLAGAALAQPLHVSGSSETLSDIHDLSGAPIVLPQGVMKLNFFPESLVFNISWGFFRVGQATMESREIVEFADHAAYHYISRAYSNPWCDSFYKVRDFNESWVDAATLDSLGYSKNLRESHYIHDEWVRYHHDGKNFLAQTRNKEGQTTYKSGDSPEHVQDILSSLYYIRSKTLQPGQDFTLDVNTMKNWPLVVHVLRKERLKVPAGTFDTIVVEPALREQGIFIQKGKSLQVWMTDDAKHMPVQMRAEVFFGHVTAQLVTGP